MRRYRRIGNAAHTRFRVSRDINEYRERVIKVVQPGARSIARVEGLTISHVRLPKRNASRVYRVAKSARRSVIRDLSFRPVCTNIDTEKAVPSINIKLKRIYSV